jgi:hypothetical protein
MDTAEKTAAQLVDEFYQRFRQKSGAESWTAESWREQWPCYGPLTLPWSGSHTYSCRSDYDPFE